MGKYSKWLGGALGWTFGGPIGGIIGFAVGSIFDTIGNIDVRKESSQRQESIRNDFGISLLVLSAAVMKADGRALRSELDFVRRFYQNQFGEGAAYEYMQIFKEVLKKDIPIHEVCIQIKSNLDYASRLMLVQYLFGISNADGVVDTKELDLISVISKYLGVYNKDFVSIRAMFIEDFEDPFSILEISPTATEEEVKKAYRKMVMKYHPDKVISLGEEHQKAAKDKFIKVQQAYERIKNEKVFA